MRLGAHAGHGVLHQDLMVAAFVGVAGGGFDADVGGDAAENDGLDGATAQLQVQFGAVKGAPLMLGDEEVAGLRPDFGNDLRPVGWEEAGLN